jgi:hypothetical protein
MTAAAANLLAVEPRSRSMNPKAQMTAPLSTTITIMRIGTPDRASGGNRYGSTAYGKTN